MHNYFKQVKKFRLNYALCINVLLLGITILLPKDLIAQTMGSVMCAAADIVTGEVAAGIATIGVCTLGAGACFGRVSWPVAIMVIVGIAGLMGASTLATNFGATQACS